jgi:hypothetical protein
MILILAFEGELGVGTVEESNFGSYHTHMGKNTTTRSTTIHHTVHTP